MIKKIISAAAILLAGSLVFAHFQMVYTPTSIIADDVKEVPFKLVFTHPFESGHTMDIGKISLLHTREKRSTLFRL